VKYGEICDFFGATCRNLGTNLCQKANIRAFKLSGNCYAASRTNLALAIAIHLTRSNHLFGDGKIPQPMSANIFRLHLLLHLWLSRPAGSDDQSVGSNKTPELGKKIYN
jgi:hypothetical protein